MIKSKSDYKYYLEEDRKVLKEKKGFKRLIVNDVYLFQYALRTLEYLENTNQKKSIKYIFWKLLYRKLSRSLGFSIPTNIFKEGLSIAHRGTIVINSRVRIGKNCRIHVCVNIGAQHGKDGGVPRIGDGCYIGPGAKIFGDIEIANNVKIGANAVVNKSFKENGVVITGIPAKVKIKI